MFRKIKKTFSHNYILSILIVTVIVFVLSFYIFYRNTYQIVSDTSTKNSENILKLANAQIVTTLREVEIAIQNISTTLDDINVTDPNILYNLTKEVVAHNHFIFGCAIALQPYHFPEKGKYFAPYAWHEGVGISRKQLGSDENDIYTQNWYALPKKLRGPIWTDPYLDVYGAGANVYMCTYSVPLMKNGKFYGIITADISLEWLAALVSKLNRDSGSYTFIIDDKGRFLTHFDKSLHLPANFTDITRGNKDSINLMRIGRKITDRQTSHDVIRGESGTSYIFYSPIQKTNWSIAMMFKEPVIYGKLDYARKVFITILSVGLFFILVVGWITIHSLTKPLGKFADALTDIILADFKLPVPLISKNKEISKLSDAFTYLQQRLIFCTEELMEMSVSKEKMEDELKLARKIQLELISSSMPVFPFALGIDMHGIAHNTEISTGFYDYFIDGKLLHFIIGDVKGSGVISSLFVSLLRHLYHIYALQYHSPETTANAINTSTSQTSVILANVLIGTFHIDEEELTYCNAGLFPPIIVNKTTDSIVAAPSDTNVPIGTAANTQYHSYSLKIHNNSIVVLHTNGVMNSYNDEGKKFGEKTFFDLLHRYRAQNPHDLANTILNDIDKFAEYRLGNDNATILILNYLKLVEKPMTRHSITIHNNVQEVMLVSELLNHIGSESNLPGYLIIQLKLLLEEIITNIIVNGYTELEHGSISISYTLNDKTLNFEITDNGRPLKDVSTIIHETMDAVDYQIYDDKNVLTLIKMMNLKEE
ncbi:MAG: SpoIIE family protein phosphatase [Ignavibacteria bacterium]|jgi:sigma-B regulation protein RsbU (phosphoserine phosphatase)|nr:SpoIIE family protein phosphatase [Ignavibacteria bacterium]